MAVTFVDSAVATGITVTIPAATQVGDYIIIAAYRPASNTTSTVPAGFTQIALASGNTNSLVVGYKIAVGSDTSGTWSAAKNMACVVYRGVGGIGKTAVRTSASSANTFINPLPTMNDPTGSEWVAGFQGSAQQTSMGTPTGMTSRAFNTTVDPSSLRASDTNAGAGSSFSSVSGANGTNAVNAGVTIELIDTNTHVYSSTTTYTPSVGGTVDAYVWGGGGGGGTNATGGGGGGGGGFSKISGQSVTGSTGYTVTVGAVGTGGVSGGVSATNGGDSWFSTTGTVLAKGGTAGDTTATGKAGGASASGVGTTKFSGGTGGNGDGAGNGGGGGGGAGPTSNGGSPSGSASGTGGTGTPPGGTGGGGGTGSFGGNGVAPGGGGGGAQSTGGNGGAGQVIIVFIPGGTLFTQALTAAASFAGSQVRTTKAVKTAGWSFTGNKQLFISKSLTAGFSFVGNLKKALAKGLTGAISFTGALTSGRLIVKALTAALSFTGSLAQRVAHVVSLTAAFSFAGSIQRALSKKISGGLSFTGAIKKALTKTLPSAALSFTGNVFKRAPKSLTGSLSFTGLGTHRMNKLFTAGLSFLGRTSIPINFIDNFDDNSISASWSASANSADSTQVKEQNQRMEITHTASAQYNALQSASQYDISGRYAFVQLVDAGNQSLASHEAILYLSPSSGNELWISVSANTVACWKKVSGSQVQIGSSVGYNSLVHRYLRIREYSGTIYFEYATDGRAWSILQTVSNPLGTTTMNVGLQSGCYATEASSSYAYFDNFNVPPPVQHLTQALTAALSFTGNLAKRTGKGFAGGLSFVGSITKGIPRNLLLVASLGFSGRVNNRQNKLFTAGLSFSGSFLSVLQSKIQLVFGKITSGFGNSTLDSQTKVASIESSDKIGTVDSNTNKTTVESQNNDTDLTSGSNKGAI